MVMPTTYSFTRYLAAKKSIDDRALNQHVWGCLTQVLPQGTPDAPVRVLEIGAGIGTMVERLVEWGLLQHATYTGIDANPETIQESRHRLPAWMLRRGFGLLEETPTRRLFRRHAHQIVVETETIDLQRFLRRTQGQRAWDLLIAHAVLDLLDLPTTLPSLLSLLRPGGLCYFTITFDGATILQPEIDPAFDAQIETLYHQTMDQRRIDGQSAGDSRSGRHLFGHLRAVGVELLDAGSSDWVIFAGPDGYPGDEAYFLHFIVYTMRMALQGHSQLDSDRFAHWIAERHAQIEQGSLVYIAHQLDFLGRVAMPATSLSRPGHRRQVKADRSTQGAFLPSP
jgi:SAM-dependent methyltransferase